MDSLDTAGLEFDSLFAASCADTESAKAESGFHTDCTWISAQVQANPDSFVCATAFVLLTIRQPFYLMATQVPDVAKRGTESVYLFGSKRAGLAYVRENKTSLHATTLDYAEGRIDLNEVIFRYMAIPGLGLVKSSFLAQLTVADGACLDTLNLRRLGMGESALKTPKTLSESAIRKRIATYNALWRAHGDSAYWWDSWCEFVASRTHNVIGSIIAGFDSALHVSAAHRIAVTGGIQ